MKPEIKELMENTEKKLTKKSIKARVKQYLIFIAILAVLGFGYYAVYKINLFFESNKLIFRTPVKIGVYSPVYITKREKPEAITLIEQVKANSPLSEIQQYICDKFGSDCKTALAVQKAENGSAQCDRFNINTNGTVDFGVFQINTVHLKKGYKLADLIDCKKNVDIAFEIYSQQKGFQAWVGFTSGNYKKFLIN